MDASDDDVEEEVNVAVVVFELTNAKPSTTHAGLAVIRQQRDAAFRAFVMVTVLVLDGVEDMRIDGRRIDGFVFVRCR